MARYDFNRLSVLIVEDSQFMRSILLQVLKALGVRNITVAKNGEEAINILSPVETNSGHKVGTGPIDLVICDYFIPKVDGGMFLLWVRRADKTPDRFLPVIMVSAAADRDVIFSCRDAGVNEFIAKPFSAVMVAQRLQATIERPRQYIYSPTYFGPDRRRQAVPVSEERRKTTDDDIEVIYAGKALGDLGASKKKIWCFRLPNRLQQKLSTGERGHPNEPMFDPDLLDEAEERIVNMETDYSDWVGDSVKSLTQELTSAGENPDQAAPHLQKINEIALEIRGQGSMFGYPLMTEFGKSLYEFTVKGNKVTTQLLELVKAHIDLINVVIQGKMKGDGGKVDQDLLKSLEQAKDKYAGKEKEKA